MSLIDDLRRVPVLAGLSEEQLGWLAANLREVRLAPGEAAVEEGAPADRMMVVLDGEIQLAREKGTADGRLGVIKTGDVSGMLPFSRMTHFTVSARAVVPSRVGFVEATLFPEMLRRIPELEPRLVGLLTDRVRESTRQDQQREKLMALGKLSAGLAHELNNPAAAVQRAASELGERLEALRQAAVALAGCSLQHDALSAALELRQAAASRQAQGPEPVDPVLQSDRESALEEWLEAHRVERAWIVAGTLASYGIVPADLEPLAARLPGDGVACLLVWLEAGLAADALLGELRAAARRISELVTAVKAYSHMDEGQGRTEIDVHRELDSALTMLAHKARAKGVAVERLYTPQLPRIEAFAGELNQVWTNLLDNAFDAVEQEGRVAIRTARENDRLLVEIRDDGPGVPPEIQARIWEPFFTTKAVGEGTGLGLDIALRIVVRRHGGTLTMSSVPGDTRFVVRLPLAAGG
ncbi:MAG TPA: ATP-binding protein [Thermoanaerobaculia bacterium]|nr:ATP-binding protein [Thermoanaerobaculia bacterium]